MESMFFQKKISESHPVGNKNFDNFLFFLFIIKFPDHNNIQEGLINEYFQKGSRHPALSDKKIEALC